MGKNIPKKPNLGGGGRRPNNTSTLYKHVVSQKVFSLLKFFLTLCQHSTEIVSTKKLILWNKIKKNKYLANIFVRKSNTITMKPKLNCQKSKNLTITLLVRFLLPFV